MPDYPPIHAPARPDWLCVTCGDPWPCPVRKRQLRELFQDNIPGLVGNMSQYLTDATGDLGRLSVIEVTERFVGWCGRPLGARYRRPEGVRREASCQWDG
jgi:hypothetical protein